MNNESSFLVRHAQAILYALAGFVIILSVFVFSKQSLRLDESQSIWQSSHSLLDVYRVIGSDVHVPLYHTLLHFWIVFFGYGVGTVRLLSLIFFLLCIPSLYRLGEYAYGKEVGVFSVILLCISPFMNWYGNEARMYSLLVLVAILNQLFFMKIWRERTPRAWLLYTLTAVLGMYTHYFFALILLTQAVYYFFNMRLFTKGDFLRFVRTAGIVLLTISPWLLYVYHLGQIGNSTPLLSPPTTVNLFNTFSQFIFGFQNDHLNTVLVSLWPIVILLGFLALRKGNETRNETIYLLLSLIFPIVLTFTVSLALRPIFVTRYLIFTLPSLYLLLGYLTLSYKQPLRRVAMIIVVFLMLSTLTVEIVNANTPVKENYEGAASYLAQYASPDDIIAVSAPFTIYPMEYYYNGPTKLTTLPIWDQSKFGPIPPFVPGNLQNEVDSLTKDHANIWVLLSYDQGYEKAIKDYFDGHFQRIDAENFSYDLNLYEYKLRY